MRASFLKTHFMYKFETWYVSGWKENVFSLYMMCTALYSELQMHDSAELDWESEIRQQAAASNPRSQSHFANQGDY